MTKEYIKDIPNWEEQYLSTEPQLTIREKELQNIEKAAKEREKAKKEFEMVDLVSPAWTIQVPRRKK